MAMLWRRMLSENKENYRRIYKSLVLLNYLLRNGSERVVTSAREHIYDLRTLENFSYVDELGKDQGINIRQRAKTTIEFLQDDNRLREERKKAKKNKDKYVGVSRSMVAGSSSSRYMDEYDEDYTSSTNSNVNVFKDEREESKPDSPEPAALSKATVSSPAKTQQLQQSQSPDNLSARSKPTKNYASKKIDLGAAADYAKQRQPEASTSKAGSQETATVKPDILFDLDSEPTASQQSAPQVADFLDSLTITAPAAATENFADFSKVFSNDDQQPVYEEIKSTTNKDDDEFDDFRFSPPPSVQPTTAVIQTATIHPQKSTTQDDLLGLDLSTGGSASSILTGPQSLPLQMNVHHSSLAGLSTSSSFFPASSNSGSNPSVFQADSFLTPLTPSKPTTLNIRSTEQLKEEETPKQSPTASAILSKKNTWSGLTENLKIDLDNLLQSKKEKPKPSMNQMAATGGNVSQTSAQGN